MIERVGGKAADRLLDLVREAFVAGLTWSFRLVALLALGGVLVSLFFVGGSLLGKRRPRAGG